MWAEPDDAAGADRFALHRFKADESYLVGEGVILACAPKQDPIYAIKAGGKGLAIDFESYGAHQFQFDAGKGRTFAATAALAPPMTHWFGPLMLAGTT